MVRLAHQVSSLTVVEVMGSQTSRLVGATASLDSARNHGMTVDVGSWVGAMPTIGAFKRTPPMDP
jgi:hypothetical protein